MRLSKLHTPPKNTIFRTENLGIKNVGKHTYGCSDLYIASPDTEIGSFCSLGMRVVLGHGIHPLNFLSTSPYFYLDDLLYKNKEMNSHHEFLDLPPIKIGHDVWIGDGVFIKNGVHVGSGAIIGARSVVTKDVPPYSIVVGVPACVIKYRFNKEIISELLALRWWDLSDEIIKRIPYDNINEAMLYLREQICKDSGKQNVLK